MELFRIAERRNPGALRLKKETPLWLSGEGGGVRSRPCDRGSHVQACLLTSRIHPTLAGCMFVNWFKLVDMETVGAFEAKTHLAALLDRVAKGEKITITRHGVPAA